MSRARSRQGIVCQAEELRIYSDMMGESLVDFNWGTTCSDMSAEKGSLAAVWRLVRRRSHLVAEK